MIAAGLASGAWIWVVYHIATTYGGGAIGWAFVMVLLTLFVNRMVGK